VHLRRPQPCLTDHGWIRGFMVRKKVEYRPRTRTRAGAGVEFGVVEVEVEGDRYDVPVFQIGCVDYLNNTIPIPTRSDQPVQAE
jgi:hypothetical protein